MKNLFKLSAYIWATGTATWLAVGIGTGESAAFGAALVMGLGCAASCALHELL
jgi:hypothetical protein